MKIFFPESTYSSLFLYLLSLILGISYCAAVVLNGPFVQNLTTIIFIILVLIIIFLNLKHIEKSDRTFFKSIIAQVALINIGIASTAYFLKSPNTFFWVDDSLKTHLIEALKFTQFFYGEAPDPTMGIYSGRSTHALTGLFIALIGENSFATIMAQLCFKLLGMYYIYKFASELWNDKIGQLAMLIYGMCPTIFFYTLVLYKESAIHAFYAAILYFSLKVYRKKYLLIIPLMIAFHLLLRERFYLAYLFFSTIFLLILSKAKTQKISIKIALFLSSIVAAIIVYKNIPFDLSSSLEILKNYRNVHAQYSDISNYYNYQIPYPVAFIKILFSPYLTFNKLNIFFGFSTLLTWGSVVNQIITLCSILGLYQAIKKNFIHIYYWTPFILFLLFTAYISPWSGRLRDSYYPLISCYASYFMYNNKYFRRMFKLDGL